MKDAVMRDKARATPKEAADKINDAVEDLTLKVAGTAVEPKAERVAANVNDQVELPEISENAALPKHIDPTSSVRVARERQSYIEQIVAAAAAPAKQAKNKTRATKKRRPALRANAR
jgi:hypothetical protein